MSFEYSLFQLHKFLYELSLSDKLCFNTEVNAHNTRGSSNFDLPKVELVFPKILYFLKRIENFALITCHHTCLPGTGKFFSFQKETIKPVLLQR